MRLLRCLTSIFLGRNGVWGKCSPLARIQNVSVLPGFYFACSSCLFPGLLSELSALGGWQMKRVPAASFALLLSCIQLVGNPGKRSEVTCFSSPLSSRLCQRVTRLVKEASSHDCLLGDSGIHLCLLFELSVSDSSIACPQDCTVIAGPSVYATFIFKLSSRNPDISTLSPKILINDSLILSWNLPRLVLFVGV